MNISLKVSDILDYITITFLVLIAIVLWNLLLVGIYKVIDTQVTTISVMAWNTVIIVNMLIKKQLELVRESNSSQWSKRKELIFSCFLFFSLAVITAICIPLMGLVTNLIWEVLYV